jgi:pimeloyl-ACP methyl ester carboxylesterase
MSASRGLQGASVKSFAIVWDHVHVEDWTMKIHTVKGAAGVNLHVREYGKSTGIPILLIHGWSQNHLCWSKQYDSTLKDDARIVALDLRGHGMSDAPVQMDQYTDGEKWADDIAAVIDELALHRVILVGWSYGGYIILDYVLRKGQSKIAGINFVAAAVVLGPKAFGPLLGPGFLENAPAACEDDLPTNIAATPNSLLFETTEGPLEPHLPWKKQGPLSFNQ